MENFISLFFSFRFFSFHNSYHKKILFQNGKKDFVGEIVVGNYNFYGFYSDICTSFCG